MTNDRASRDADDRTTPRSSEPAGHLGGPAVRPAHDHRRPVHALRRDPVHRRAVRQPRGDRRRPTGSTSTSGPAWRCSCSARCSCCGCGCGRWTSSTGPSAAEQAGLAEGPPGSLRADSCVTSRAWTDAGLPSGGGPSTRPWLRWQPRRAEVRRASTSPGGISCGPARAPSGRAHRRGARPGRPRRPAADFEVRHVDGTDRPRCCRRWPTPTRCSCAAPPGSTPRRSPPRRGSRSSPGPASGWTTSTCRRPPPAASWSSTRRPPTSSPPPSRPSRCCSRSPATSPQRIAVAQGRASGSGPSTPASSWPDKTVGVVGLGRIGVLFAQRMAAFGIRLIAYDPYVQPARAAAARRAPGRPGRAAARVATSSRSTCPRRRRRSA